jgi:hypothetical protein
MGNILSKIAKKIELLPEVDFSISTTGITIYSKRFKEPRYLEFEKKGKCRNCKTGVSDIGYYIDATGVGINCSRFDGLRYVLFDYPIELEHECIFRVRTKPLSYNIPYNAPESQMLETPLPPMQLQQEEVTDEQPMDGQQNGGGQNSAEQPMEIVGEQNSGEHQIKEENI